MHTLDGENTSSSSISMLDSTEFQSFLARNGINLEWYTTQTTAVIPRCVRVTRALPSTSPSTSSSTTTTRTTTTEVEDELQKIGAEKLRWLPEFWTLANDNGIANVELYRCAKVFAMDPASGFIVHTLGAKPGEQVLDLCCAPGGKLCMIADMMQRKGTLVGIDQSQDRMKTCASIARKYRICQGNGSWDCRLVVGDGVSWSLDAVDEDSVMWDTELDGLFFRDTDGLQHGTKRSPRRRLNRSMKRRLMAHRVQRQLLPLPELFDRVLVDAECTHDGSVQHVVGLEGRSKGFSFEDEPRGCRSLSGLQKGLLLNGFKLLKPGGVLVYSTCSFCVKQNEEVVKWLLDSYSCGPGYNGYEPKLLPIDLAETGAPGSDSATLPGCVRFEPLRSRTNGLFVSKLTKVEYHNS